MTTYSIADFGAVSEGDPATNQAAFAAAMAACVSGAGDVVLVPVGYFEVTPPGAVAYCVLVDKDDVTILGESRTGSIVAMTAADAIELAANRLFKLEADRVTIRGLTLEGNKPNRNTVTVYEPTTVEQHAGFFAGPNIEDPVVEECDIRNFTGDGGVFYLGTVRPTFRNNLVEYTQRNGITFNPSYNHETQEANPVFDARVYGNTFQHVTVQPIDNEHGPVHGNEIYENQFLSPGFQSYAITCSGYSDIIGHNSRSTGWYIHDNYFEQGLFLIRCSDAVVSSNVFQNGTTKPCVEFSRAAYNVVIADNEMHQNQTGTPGVHAVHIAGTADGGPTAITVQGNKIYTALATSSGINAQGCVSVRIADNHLTGAGATAAGYAGIACRTTVEDRDFESAVVLGNCVQDYGQYGIRLQGNGAALLLYAEVRGNVVSNTSPTGPQTIGIDLDDGTGALQQGLVSGNTYGQGVTTQVADIPVGADMVYSLPVGATAVGTVHSTSPSSV